MRLDSARELKAALVKEVASSEPADLSAGGVWPMTARPRNAVDPVARSVAVGITRAGRGVADFRLAVRVQRRGLENSRTLETIHRRARGEVEVRYVGHVVKQAAPWQQTRRRPLLIGLSVGHFRITAGTLGAFVSLKKMAAEVRFLSNNHVLADEDRAKAGDAILQPGAYDGGRNPGDRAGALDGVVRLKRRGINRVDDQGNLRFDGQIEIEGASTDAFSQGGDSGSLIFTSLGQHAAALLFAGGDQGGSNGKGLTFANPISVVLAQLKVELVTA